MTAHVYRLMEIVAWPAAAWGTIELGLRAATGYSDELAASLGLTVLAAGTIAACRWRSRQLAVEPHRKDAQT